MERMKMSYKGRIIGADVIRIVACFSVISVHFFLNNGFYSEPVVGGKMFIMLFMRTGFMVCVPLFILLTGYLMRSKKLKKTYYLKGVKTLIIYLFASIACIAFKLYFRISNSLIQEIRGIFNYTAAPYSWYIEMYFGLFLLIPFINILYDSLNSQKRKRWFIGTLLFLTSLPLIVNVYNLSDLHWWETPVNSSDYQQLLPQWWVGIYPLTYYFIGAYINEYGIQLKSSSNKILIIVVLLVNTLYNYWRSKGAVFVWGPWSDWGSLFNVILSTLLFVLLVNIDYEQKSNCFKKIIGVISNLCLGAYLVSYIFDKIFYAILCKCVPIMQQRLPFYFVIVPIIFFCSLIVSGIFELIYIAGASLFKKDRKSVV